ncbi:hypothetical protein FRC01_006804, partial [Tulasnella sp. 417]
MTSTRPQPPPLRLREDIERLVFTHKSRHPRPNNMIDDDDDPQDWERVAFLGEGILIAAMSRVLYYAYPRRRPSHLKPNRAQMLSKDSLASITDAYGFMGQMKCLEANRDQLLVSVDTRASLIESFVGGLALQYGVSIATQWAAEVLAWKYGLPVPPSDEQRLGQGPVASAMPMSTHPTQTAVSPTPPPGPGPMYIRPARSIAPRPGDPQIRPPPEAPGPAMEYGAPFQQYVYGHPAMYQGVSPPHHQATGVAAPTPPIYYNPASYTSRPLPQSGPYMQAPSSPPVAAPGPQQAPQQADQRSFSYNSPPGAPPSFSESVNYQQPPPQAAVAQSQFQRAADSIPAWSPQ